MCERDGHKLNYNNVRQGNIRGEGEINFKEGDTIWYKHSYKFVVKWFPGDVLRRIGNKVYRILVNGTVKDVHGSHLAKRHEAKFDVCDFDRKKEIEFKESSTSSNKRPYKEIKKQVKFQDEEFKSYYYNK